MSPKPSISMILFMPYYLFNALLVNSKFSKNKKITKIAYCVFISCVWLLLLSISNNIFVNYFCANLGTLGLLMGNIYAHVENTDELFGKNDNEFHIVFNIIVTLGSVAFMLLFAYIPYVIYHQYVPVIKTGYSIGVFNIVSIIILLELMFLLLCKELFIDLPKSSTGNYLFGSDRPNTMYVCFYYIVAIIFILMLLRDATFISSMRPLLIKII